ncbi:PriCT-2 domain-containing protein (plasmid) [Roseomonas marmotae]|uniref:VapE domain-containing protein n=1 Tax=Roseomonas marmotae TaxID=2768161 RepID=UPI001AD616BB|nr:VapE domain-containing protein [Roseomonas marmotae]QTI81475.1 PriCT-2 domain-containing protein [Roseomonas marmotae]
MTPIKRMYDAAEVRNILRYLDPNCDRETWARVAMAVKSELGQAGLDVFDDWSQMGSNYSRADCRDTYKSVKESGGVTIGTLIFEAKRNGYQIDGDSVPEIDPNEAFRREQERLAAEAARKRAQHAAEGLAARFWDAGVPCDVHPYLTSKAVRSHGLRAGAFPHVGDDGEIYATEPGALLVPICDAKTDRVTSLQGIYVRDGSIQKRYLKDGRKKGGCYIIGQPPSDAGGILAFAEGYATGATVHELTGWCVCVCFDAANVPTVADAMRKRFPSASLIFCADNDRANPKNPGVTYASQAAGKTRGCVVVPEFPETDKAGSDFNDLAASVSPDEAKRQLLDNPITSPAPANDNIDYFTPLPFINGKGKPLNTIENLEEICRRLGYQIRYNLITKEEEILIAGERYSVDNASNASYAKLESQCARFEFSTDKLTSFLTYLADRNPYNPVAEWIESKPWDGQSRLQDLYDTIQPVHPTMLSDGRKLHEVLILRWLISAVAAAFSPTGVSAHGILVLQGAQYMGKTMWFKRLAPESMGVVQDGLMLRPDDRDSIKQVCSFWLVELGELDATFRKADIAALKSFITRKQDVLRLAYARRESKFPRRTVFFGSVNPHEFLRDATGNRRYWTIECASIDCNHNVEMQQLWAEVLTLYRKGVPYYLLPEEMEALNAYNESFQVIDPIEQRLQSLDWKAPSESWQWHSATEILDALGVVHYGIPEATKAATIIRRMNGNRGKKSNGRRVLLCPPLDRASTSQPEGSGEDEPF